MLDEEDVEGCRAREKTTKEREMPFFVAVHIYLEGKKGKEEEKSTQKIRTKLSKRNIQGRENFFLVYEVAVSQSSPSQRRPSVAMISRSFCLILCRQWEYQGVPLGFLATTFRRQFYAGRRAASLRPRLRNQVDIHVFVK